jgi:hypothetical protein
MGVRDLTDAIIIEARFFKSSDFGKWDFVAVRRYLYAVQKTSKRFDVSVNPIIEQRFTTEGNESHSKPIAYSVLLRIPEN